MVGKTRGERSIGERWINGLLTGFLFALPGWFCVRVFDASPLVAIVPAAVLGFALGWFAGNVILFVLDVILGLFR